MGWLGNLFKKKEEKTEDNPYVMRAKKARITRLENQLANFSLERKQRKLERLKSKMEEAYLDEDIADLEEQLYREEDTQQEELSIDNMLSNLLNNAMQKNPKLQALINGEQAPTGSTGTDLTDEEIQMTLDQIPDQDMMYLGKLPEDQLRTLIVQKYPSASAGTVAKTIQMIKAEVA